MLKADFGQVLISSGSERKKFRLFELLIINSGKVKFNSNVVRISLESHEKYQQMERQLEKWSLAES